MTTSGSAQSDGQGSTDHAEWNAVLGHELRSPVAAILGYQELLEEGTFGELPPSAADAVRRIRLAADQLLVLIDAIEQTTDDEDGPAPVSARELCNHAAAAIRLEAEARDTRIDIAPDDFDLFTRRTDACRTLALALGAAVKVSPGATITLASHDGPVPLITISGTRLDLRRDRVHPDTPLTGAGLRLQLARIAAGLAGGSLDLDESGSVHVLLPRLPKSD